MDYLRKAVHSPAKPYVAILGGAKVEDKIPVIENLLNKADDILIGGAMAYTFLKAQGEDVGRSLVEDDKKDIALKILTKAAEKKVRLPPAARPRPGDGRRRRPPRPGSWTGRRSRRI